MQEDKYGVKGIQQDLMPLLKYVDGFLREQGIEYSLTYGSLLGQVRHGGFIPWDDDLDIMLDRQSYRKLISVKDKLDKDFRFEKGTWLPRIFAKASHQDIADRVFVDIFVMDRVPKSGFKAGFKLGLIDFLMGMMHRKLNLSMYSVKWKPAIFVSWLVGRLFPMRWIQRWFDKVSAWGGKEGDMKIYNGIFKYVNGKQYSPNVMDGYKDADFDGLKVRIVQNPDIFLRETYGDYMTPPPEAQRVPTHFKLDE